MSETQAPAPSRAAFTFIFITVCLDMVALGVMIPVLPKLVLQFSSDNIGRAAQLTGLFGFVWAAMQFVCSPLMGALSDRFGRRPVVLLSNFGLGLDYILMALAPNITWLFVGRVISGITSASFSTASAYIADVTPVHKRSARFGMLGAAFGIGFIIGPAIGGLLGSISLRLPFWAAGVVSLCNAVYGFFILPESLPLSARQPFTWRSAHPLSAWRFFRDIPPLRKLALATFTFYLAHEALPNVFVLYTHYRFAWDERTVGLALAAIGLCSGVVSGVLTGRVVHMLGEYRTSVVALLAGISAFVVYGLSPNGRIFSLGIVLIAVMGFFGAATQTQMSAMIDAHEQGRLQGALNSMRGVTGMVGPLLYTQLFALGLAHPDIFHMPGVPFILAALLLCGGLLLVVRTGPKIPSPLEVSHVEGTPVQKGE